MSPSTRPVSRRTAVGAAVVAGVAGAGLISGVVSGCTLDPPPPVPTPGARPEPDADVLLLQAVLGALDDTASLAAATIARHGGLTPGLRPLVDAHGAHRAVLDEAAEVERGTADPASVPGRRALALDRVRRAEDRLVGTLREATTTAQSGDLARALASMAASLTQHLTVLDDGVRGADGPAA